MREIAYSKLSPEGFAVFGAYANMTSPSGPKLGAEPIEFYRDMVQASFGLTQTASFSITRVARRPFVMDVSEYHDSCCEIVLPLDGDVLMHVAPAGAQKEFPFDEAKVFLVPRGTICCLRPGVWHHAPYALGAAVVNCLVVLPERIYMNDCKVWPFPKDHSVKIVGEGTR
jgi:ureidoglycolate lyase